MNTVNDNVPDNYDLYMAYERMLQRWEKEEEELPDEYYIMAIPIQDL